MKRLILVLLTVGLVACGNLELKTHIRDGHRFYENNQYKEAIAEYEKVLELDPSKKEFYAYIARAQQDIFTKYIGTAEAEERGQAAIDRWEEVKSHFDKETPEFKEADSQSTLILDRTGKKETGIDYYKKLVEKDSSAGNYLLLAEFQFKQLQYEDAIDTLDQRMEKNPDDKWIVLTKAIYLWAWVYKEKTLPPDIKRNIVDKGMETVEKCIAMDPNLATPYSYRNLLYRQLADLEPDKRADYMAKAKADVEKFKELWPAEKVWREEQKAKMAAPPKE